MTGTSDTKPIWPDRMPNVNVNAKIIDHPAWNCNLRSGDRLSEGARVSATKFSSLALLFYKKNTEICLTMARSKESHLQDYRT